MEPSLSIILPVHNAETTLCQNVERVLELAGDLADRFEVLIVDDGSTDQTFEIAHDLSVRFPQVRLVHNARREGLENAIREAISQTIGQIVCVHEGGEQLMLGDLRDLWRLRNDRDLVVASHARQRVGATQRWLKPARRSLATTSDTTNSGGFHLLRRDNMAAVDGQMPVVTSRHTVRLRRDGPASPVLGGLAPASRRVATRASRS